MRSFITVFRFFTVVLLAGFILLSAVASAEKATADQEKVNPLLHPELATATAPATFKVKVMTTVGDFVIQVHREWAPHGADRFYNLVKIGYYDDTAFFRVIDDFMAQVGFNGDPEVNQVWRTATIPDDPATKVNYRGRVTFAMSAKPNTRTTQFFINFKDNSYLKRHGEFAPFGEIVEGMETVDRIYSGYGEGAPSGQGPSQVQISTHGNSYLRENFPKLDYILKAEIIDK